MADCETVSSVLPVVSCGGGTFRLAPEAARRLGPVAGLTGRTSTPADGTVASTLFVGTDGGLENVLRAAVLNGGQIGRSIVVPARSTMHESPLVAWILAGLGLTAALAGATVLILAHAQGVGGAASAARLTAIGATGGQVRGLMAAQAAITVGVVVVIGGALASVACWSFAAIEPAAGVPVPAIAGTLAVGALAAGAAAIGAAGAAIPRAGRSRPGDAGHP